MAQTDKYNMPNSNGAAFEVNLEQVFDAIRTANSGTSAPTSTLQFMPWVDTNASPPILKFRNAANNGWISFAEFVDGSTVQLLPGVVGTLGFQPGDVKWTASSTVPDGFVKANGAALSRTTYSELFAEIGTTFGNGNGSTTFNVPDLRGEFVRGWDDGRGVDSGRSLGSSQAEDFKSHNHSKNTLAVDTNTDLGGLFEMRRREGGASNAFAPSGVFTSVTSGGNQATVASAADVRPVDQVRFDGDHAHTLSGVIGNSGGSETRPRNVAMMAIIKF